MSRSAALPCYECPFPAKLPHTEPLNHLMPDLNLCMRLFECVCVRRRRRRRRAKSDVTGQCLRPDLQIALVCGGLSQVPATSFEPTAFLVALIRPVHFPGRPFPSLPLSRSSCPPIRSSFLPFLPVEYIPSHPSRFSFSFPIFSLLFAPRPPSPQKATNSRRRKSERRFIANQVATSFHL